MKLYLARGKDMSFLFTNRVQYCFDKGNELFIYHNYLQVHDNLIFKNITAIKEMYSSFKLGNLCVGDYTITEL